jgi:hypothetical protein
LRVKAGGGEEVEVLDELWVTDTVEVEWTVVMVVEVDLPIEVVVEEVLVGLAVEVVR